MNSIMNSMMKKYCDRAAAIVGERTPGEIVHDEAVVEALNQGHKIEKALAIAGKKFPDEAIQWDSSNIGDITAHYEYQQNHSRIMALSGAGRTKKRIVHPSSS